MQIPVQIVFRGIDHSDAVEERIREKAAKLEQFHKNITACRVVVEMHHKNTSHVHKRGEPFLISVQVSVPGEDLNAVSSHGKDADLKAHEDVGIALRDAFESMERQLRDIAERKRAEQKVEAKVIPE
ncbi:ribose ABC transporter permease [Rhodospirillum rubrum]|uniref:HPF/RaiA family ribosome-associated protein n=1 Tax=Rhodospirillum rubrum TaxID=1085 RepID=UPI001908F5E2|nr:HPF/RaiA family ribosome-associated protein [Rhodospirillum rubrum]MBK1665203.1 ribose ABC transporter permease [Rhodospirillum rubrum]MBK1677053.1 ribose ABC transporter permease [Rhodospirillum rubrum]